MFPHHHESAVTSHSPCKYICAVAQLLEQSWDDAHISIRPRLLYLQLPTGCSDQAGQRRAGGECQLLRGEIGNRLLFSHPICPSYAAPEDGPMPATLRKQNHPD